MDVNKRAEMQNVQDDVFLAVVLDASLDAMIIVNLNV